MNPAPPVTRMLLMEKISWCFCVSLRLSEIKQSNPRHALRTAPRRHRHRLNFVAIGTGRLKAHSYPHRLSERKCTEARGPSQQRRQSKRRKETRAASPIATSTHQSAAVKRAVRFRHQSLLFATTCDVNKYANRTPHRAVTIL